MKALSIKQPWAWLILEGYPPKDYENRNWDRVYCKTQMGICRPPCNILIHASKGMTVKEYDDACEFAIQRGVRLLPQFDRLQRGGIVGMVLFDGMVTNSPSEWFTGPLALRLKNPYPLPFTPCKGQLGFFDVEHILVQSATPKTEHILHTLQNALHECD